MRKLLLSLYFLALAALPVAAQETSRFDLSAGYSGIHANEPPGNCNCFLANGGSASLAYNFNRWVGVFGDFGSVHSGNVNSSATDLTLTTYLFGPRFTFRKYEQFTPFGQFFLGGAHAGGSLLLNTAGSNSANSAAVGLGGGLDVNVYHRFAVRAFQFEYLHTTFPNGVNDRQNIFRFTFGVVYRFGSNSATSHPTSSPQSSP
jgi:hypothetical protein